MKEPKCHYMDQLGCEDAKNKSEYYTVIGAEYEYKNFIELQANSKCYKSMSKHAQYWNEIKPNMIVEF